MDFCNIHFCVLCDIIISLIHLAVEAICEGNLSVYRQQLLPYSRVIVPYTDNGFFLNSVSLITILHRHLLYRIFLVEKTTKNGFAGFQEVLRLHETVEFVGFVLIYGMICLDGYLTKKLGISLLFHVHIGDNSTKFEVFFFISS